MIVTTKMINEFVRLYTKENLSHKKIAKLCNVSEATVRNYLISQGIEANIRKKRGARHKLYKKKYIIALYDLNDNLFRIFDNGYELASFLNRGLNSVYRQLNLRFIHKKLRYNGNWYKKVLIEVN